MFQNRFSRRMLVATPCSRKERDRERYSSGSAPMKIWHMAEPPFRWTAAAQAVDNPL
jgi:hypothetical protein